MFCSFDSLCYPGVQPDNDVYFGINRVIGGTYRPGTGVCDANVNWIQCKKIGRAKSTTYQTMKSTMANMFVLQMSYHGINMNQSLHPNRQRQQLSFRAQYQSISQRSYPSIQLK